MSITRIAPERCSIARSPGSEQGRRSRSRGRSTTAFTQTERLAGGSGFWTKPVLPTAGAPRCARASYSLCPAGRVADSGWRLRSVLRLTRLRCPRAARGAGAMPPTNLPARRRASERWGVQRFAAPPRQPIDPAGAGRDGLGGGLDALAPHHAWRVVAPLRHRLVAGDCATASCKPGTSGKDGQTARAALYRTIGLRLKLGNSVRK